LASSDCEGILGTDEEQKGTGEVDSKGISEKLRVLRAKIQKRGDPDA